MAERQVSVDVLTEGCDQGADNEGYQEEAARARITRATVVPRGVIRQMTLRDCCISLNAPDAVITSVTIPVAAARKPAELLAALRMAVWSELALCWPISPES